jgi:hypothetical protein
VAGKGEFRHPTIKGHTYRNAFLERVRTFVSKILKGSLLPFLSIELTLPKDENYAASEKGIH